MNWKVDNWACSIDSHNHFWVNINFNLHIRDVTPWEYLWKKLPLIPSKNWLNNIFFLLSSTASIPNLHRNDAVTWFTLHNIKDGNVMSLSEAVVVFIEVTVPESKYSRKFRIEVIKERAKDASTTCKNKSYIIIKTDKHKSTSPSSTLRQVLKIFPLSLLILPSGLHVRNDPFCLYLNIEIS